MKKLILLLFLSIFLISIVSADTCTPDSGYNRCFYSTNTKSYGSCTAKATAKVQSHTVQIENGRKVGEYVTGRAYIMYKFDGDYFGLFEDRTWDYIWEQDTCNRDGCSINFDKTLSKEGIYYLTNHKGDSYNKQPRFAVWDHDLVEKSSCWVWAVKGHGWGYKNKLNYKQVECYDDSDCNSGETCDKSEDWKEWNCKVKECGLGEEECMGNDYHICENYVMVNKGPIIGKCDVECLTNNDCLNQIVAFSTTETDRAKCINYKCIECTSGEKEYYDCGDSFVPRKWVKKECVEGKWQDKVYIQVLGVSPCTCVDNLPCSIGNICQDGTCVEPTCIEGQIKYYECEDGSQVEWCHCENNEWVCIISPESQCKKDNTLLIILIILMVVGIIIGIFYTPKIIKKFMKKLK